MTMWWERRLREGGGVATTADLHAMGLDDVEIRMFVGYGGLIRVRRGWYAGPTAHPRAVEAVRLGGRLACVSALHARGVPLVDDGRLHIELPANAVLRSAARDAFRVRVHWRRRPSRGDRGMVDVGAAWAQARACRISAQPIP